MEEVAISVIIPIYNADLYLEQCIGSVLNQTFKNIEIICVDDGSKDKSLSIIEDYEKNDNRVIVLKQKHCNSGRARNLGLKNAKGKYVLFLDADDFLEIDAISKLYSKVDVYDVDVVIFGAYRYNSINNKKTYFNEILKINIENLKENIIKKEAACEFLFDSFGSVVWNKLIRRDLLKRYKIKFQEITRSNDIYFSLITLLQSDSLYIFKEPLINYRIGHENHLQAHNENEPIDFLIALLKTQNKLQDTLKDGYSKYENSFLNCALSIINYNLETLSKFPKEYFFVANACSYLGENHFKILEHNENYYKNKNDYFNYKKMIEDFFLFSMDFNNYQAFKSSRLFKYFIIKNELFKLFNGFVLCLRDNGLIYTFKRSIEHLKNYRNFKS